MTTRNDECVAPRRHALVCTAVERPFQVGYRDSRTTGPSAHRRLQRVVQSRPRYGAERRNYDPQQPFTAQWLRCDMLWTFNRVVSRTVHGHSDTFKRRRTSSRWPLRAFTKNVGTRNRFRLYSGVRGCDSAHHAVDDWRLRVWFVAVRWPRPAGMTLHTRRPLPNHRRPMPSCL